MYDFKNISKILSKKFRFFLDFSSLQAFLIPNASKYGATIYCAGSDMIGRSSSTPFAAVSIASSSAIKSSIHQCKLCICCSYIFSHCHRFFNCYLCFCLISFLANFYRHNNVCLSRFLCCYDTFFIHRCNS